MKYIIYRILLVAVLTIAAYSVSFAQAGTSNNQKSQPAWGPAGYTQADYYYLPDAETYYSVSSQQFIYLKGGQWIYSAALPPQYKNYDLYSGYKVVVNKPRPFLNFSEDRVQYNKFKGLKNQQQTIRDTRVKDPTDQHVLIQPDPVKKKDTGANFGPR